MKCCHKSHGKYTKIYMKTENKGRGQKNSGMLADSQNAGKQRMINWKNWIKLECLTIRCTGLFSVKKAKEPVHKNRLLFPVICINLQTGEWLPPAIKRGMIRPKSRQNKA